MNFKLFFLILGIFIFSSLAQAVTLDLAGKTDYARGESIAITVRNCAGWSALQIFSARDEGLNLVDINHGSSDWQYLYNTNSDLSDGKYRLYTSCADGTTYDTHVCINQPGCLISTPPEPESTGGTSGGHGGGGGCIPQWACSSEWTLCNTTLQQSRQCRDTGDCYLKPKLEVRACSPCPESWVCTQWSGCSNGMQIRTCTDERKCGTSLSMPALQKACSIAVPPGPQPVRIVNQPPVPPVQQQPAELPISSFWESYKVYIFSGGGLVLIVLIILIMMVIHRPKKAVNFDDLVEWIRKEKEYGTSDDVVRKTLQKTEWTSPEISRAYQMLSAK